LHDFSYSNLVKALCASQFSAENLEIKRRSAAQIGERIRLLQFGMGTNRIVQTSPHLAYQSIVAAAPKQAYPADLPAC
jgi:hypothetical protein